MKKFILFIWQLPQMIIAFIYQMYLIYSNNYLGAYEENDNIIHQCVMRGAVTLGNNIFINVGTFNMEQVLEHEYGHTIQSKILGPLYLIIIGIPSITWAGLRRLIPSLREYSYYSFYTEKWANKLANKA